MALKKGPVISIEQLEVGKAYSIANGGVAYFVVIEKIEGGFKVDYPKKENKYRIQTKMFADYGKKPIEGTPYYNHTQFQERLTIKPVIISNSIFN